MKRISEEGACMFYLRGGLLFFSILTWSFSLYADCESLRKDVLKNCKNLKPNLDLACDLAEGLVLPPENYSGPLELEDHEQPEPDLPQNIKFEKPAASTSDPGMDPAFVLSTCVGLCQAENRVDAFRVCCVADFTDSISCKD